MEKTCVFVTDLMTGARTVITKDGARELGTIMPQVTDSRQQPKSLAHKMLEAHLRIERDAYCNFCDCQFTDDEQLRCAACGRRR